MYSIENDGHLVASSLPRVETDQAPQILKTVLINSVNYAYVTNLKSNNISSFSISENGELSPLNNGKISTGDNPHYMSISDNNGLYYLYTVNKLGNTISMYSIGKNGKLTKISPSTMPSGSAPYSSEIVNVKGIDYMYVVNNGDNTVSMFSIETNGQLKRLTNATISTGPKPQYISTIHINDIDYIYVTNSFDNSISMYYIGSNSELVPLNPSTVTTGSTPVPFFRIKPITINNKNYMYVPDFNNNSVSVYSIADNGQLLLIPMSTVSTGTNPFSIEIASINGNNYAYISNDTGYSISMYSILDNGLLRPLYPNNIVTGIGSNSSSNYITIVSIDSPFPISNICFLGHTLIETDQGYIPIYKIKRDIHTIGGKKIVDITRTKTKDPHLVCFKKHVLGQNMPMEKTVMSADHKVLMNGKLTEAKNFVGKVSGVTYVKYNGEILYNILMEEYSIIKANNLTCETLHPDNMIAKLYTRKSKFSADEREKIVFQLQDCVDKKNTEKYKQIMKKC